MDALELKERLTLRCGVFYWLHAAKGINANSIAGHKSNAGYITIRLNGKSYYAHRLVWLYCNGCFPDGDIDHVNGDRCDNNIENLRVVTKLENNRNATLCSRNKSGVIGVHWDNGTNKWRASISVNNKTKYIGIYSDIEKAKRARKLAEEKHGFHANHGKRNDYAGPAIT